MSASVNYNNKRKSKYWHETTHHTDVLNLEENKFDCKKNCLCQIRHVHEMGEIQRAQEQLIDDVSVQKLRDNHETIQQLTSQLQRMQDLKSNFC